MKLSIETKPETFTLSSGDFLGVIFLRLGETAFPHAEWDDFVPTILNWWLAEVTKLLRREKDTGTFSFMDGPYWFEVDVADGRVRLVDDHDDERRIVAEGATDLKALATSLLATAREVQAFSATKGWTNSAREVRELTTTVAALIAALAIS